MSDYKINFDDLKWESPLAGVRFKRYISGKKQIRFIEYRREFVEPDWCTKGHIGYVIKGEIEIDFNGTIIKYKSGDAIVIPAGENSKHKAGIISEIATVYLVEDI